MVGDKQLETLINIERLDFFGLTISCFTKSELKKYIVQTVNQKQNKIFYGHSLGNIPVMIKCPDIYYYCEKSDVMVSDGRPLYILSKLSGLPVKYDISIPNLVMLSLRLANEFNWSVYLLGAEPNVNEKAQKNIVLKYPYLSKTGGHHGYFSNEEKEIILKNIKCFKPNLLLIGMSSPVKEKIAVDIRQQSIANIIIPCGGMLDIIAGKTKLTPKWAKKIGVASFYRVAQEPKRLLKRYMYIYGFLLFKFLPVYFYKHFIQKDKKFSIVEYFKIIK